jgi:hypothetical protein
MTMKSITKIDHGNLTYALSQIDTFLDVTEEDLLRIYALATEHAYMSSIQGTRH